VESLKIIVMLAVAVLSQSAGNVLLSKGMKQIAGSDPVVLSRWGAMLLQAATNPTVLAGAGLFVVFFVLWTVALSRADLSFVLPAVSFEVILNVAFARWFLEEMVSPVRWAGALLIVIGVILVIRSGHRTFDRSLAPAVAIDEACG